MSLERHDFADRQALADALAGSVAGDLAAGIARRGSAALAVSGGSTPGLFFAALSAHAEIDWHKVVVTLVDERWVDEASDRSNARLVKENLLRGPASRARFVPLHVPSAEPDASALQAVARNLADVPMPFDAVVLGMGSDGHTASFFPGGDTLEAALADPGPVISIRAPGAGEPRITLTLPRLLATKALYLHIEGGQKARVLETALGDGPMAEMPVRAVLRQIERPVAVYWCP